MLSVYILGKNLFNNKIQLKYNWLIRSKYVIRKINIINIIYIFFIY